MAVSLIETFLSVSYDGTFEFYHIFSTIHAFELNLDFNKLKGSVPRILDVLLLPVAVVLAPSPLSAGGHTRSLLAPFMHAFLSYPGVFFWLIICFCQSVARYLLKKHSVHDCPGPINVQSCPTCQHRTHLSYRAYLGQAYHTKGSRTIKKAQK